MNNSTPAVISMIDRGRDRGRIDRAVSGVLHDVARFERQQGRALDWGPHMRSIVDEAGEIIAKATDDHTLIGGHHRLAVAASLGRKLFWKHTGEPVKLDPFFKGSSHRDRPQ